MLERPSDQSQQLLFHIGLFLIIGGFLLAASTGLSASIAVSGSGSNGKLFTWLAIGSGTSSIFFIVVGNYFRMRALGRIGRNRHFHNDSDAIHDLRTR